MSKYGEIIYGTGAKYGELARTTLSAEPITATAIDYGQVDLSWVKPSGSYVAFRVVRNQNAFPETEEDGKIVYEWYYPASGPNGYSAESPFSDIDTTIVAGRFAYYRTWILAYSSGEWAPAGDAYTLVPSPHTLTDTGLVPITTHDRVMSYFPRMLVSQTNSPLDEIDSNYDPVQDYSGATNNTLISKFMEGFSYTVDEFLTFAERILPTPSVADSSPSMLTLQSLQLGLPLDPRGITRQQKRLVREAVRIYKGKGTVKSLSEFSEAMTGFAPTITTTNNLMLSIQDSTFNLPNWVSGAVGRWVTGDGATLTVDSTTTPVTAEDYSLDDIFTGKVVTTGTTKSIELGNDYPITRGIPVTAGQYYQISMWSKSSSSSATITPTISWYDRNGVIISSSNGTAWTAGTSWGTRDYANMLAPTGATYAGIQFVFSAATNYWIDMISFAEVAGSSSTRTTYYEPRGVNIFFKPSKINYIDNPSWETNTTNWTYSGGTQALTPYPAGDAYNGPVGARFGLQYLDITSASSGTTYATNYTTVNTGSYYTFSIYAKSATINKTAAIKLYWLEGSTATGEVSKTITLTPTWQRFSVTIYIPKEVDSNGDTITKSLGARINGTWGGEVISLDCAQLEPSYGYTDYFDGNVAGVSWSGTANLSYSYSYPNRDIKLKRFANYLPRFLPVNTPYYVDYYSDDVNDIKYSGIA